MTEPKQEPAGFASRPAYSSVLMTLGQFLGLVLIIALFAVLEPKLFFTLYNFRIVAVQTVIVALAAMGMTLIIISGGIDLSVGSVIALVTVSTALALQHGWPPILAALVGVLTGATCGLLSGCFITGLRIVPFIATLGMLGIARGVAKYLAAEQKIDAIPGWLAQLMTKFPPWDWLALPVGVWLMAVLAVVMGLMLRYTVFGRYVFAIGSNEATARLCGINVGRTKICIYALAGLFTGLAGIMQFSRLTVGDPTVAMGKELDVIAAVVIGGGSLSGGQGSILGTMIGAFIMGFLRNGCDAIRVPNFVQEIIIGVIIIAAVAVDQFRQRRRV